MSQTLESFLPLAQFVIITFLVIGVVRFLKWRGIFSDEYQPVFNKLVTEIAMPAVIFTIFATSSFNIEILIPAAILFLSLIICLIIAYFICRAFHLPKKTTGSLVMVAGFGSTATLAIPVIYDTFTAVNTAYQDAIIIGTLGVAFPFFTLGVLIASYFGSDDEQTEGKILQILKDFLTTPIFISFVIGAIFAVLLSIFDIPGAFIFSDIFTHFFTIIDKSLALLVWIAIGLMLNSIRLKQFLSFLLMVVLIKMFIGPFIVFVCSGAMGVSDSTGNLLLFEAAAPSGAIAAVLAARYGCDGPLAAWMVMGTYLVALVSYPLIFLVLT